jgi:hypothetical protein
MATSYSVNITMSSTTVSALIANQYQLFAFKAADGPASGVPVVWFSTSNYSTQSTISWQEQYAGYTSTTTSLAPETTIVASFSAPMNLGQTMNVGAGGVGTVVNSGSPGYLDIFNQTTTPYTCGVSVFNQVTNSSNPICAFNLFGSGLDTFVPVEIIYLMFATQAVNTGTVIEQSFAPGIQVNMTGQSTPAPLTFDINNGWTGPGYSTNYPANQNLLPLLINPGGEQAVSVRAATRLRLSLL